MLDSVYMKITKFGQCCLLIEHNDKRILTDPGNFAEGYVDLTDLDLILITHEHADHLHTDSLQTLVTNNPQARVVCNQSVGKILAEHNIAYTVLEGRDSDVVAAVPLAAYDGPHAEIFEDFGQVQNTGYFIDNALFYPGDAYTIPDAVPQVLALPVGGPWCKLPDALHYATQVQPQVAFPVHDWTLTETGTALAYRIATAVLSEHNIPFKALHNGETIEV